MAYIDLPTYEQMSVEIQKRAEPILKKTGELGEIFQLLALDEKVYFATDYMVQEYLIKQTLLSYEIKEAIALLISKENSCKMCIGVHKNIAKMLGLSEEKIDEILNGVNSMSNSTKDKVLLNFCIRASQKDNYKITKSDIDSVKLHGWSDNELLEAIAIVGYFNYINTLSNVFGLGE